ncbi:hypothetical protein C0Q70_12037 [Pomacea canaliculata]|uniref:Uncharacterized protein n=1 Tax=Pomacea canaliculata TaxID=400727 RepID=A0A2T7P0G8_POMCA|nr:hypothetical protein C0Q70_12037 [Pomacea canaliculata]
MKYLARFDWKKHPARKDSLVEIHLDCYLEDSDICKAIVDTLIDISNHHKIESVIYQLHTSRKIRLFGIKVNPLCFVLEQPNFVQKKGLWGISLEHDTVESVDHIIRIISSLLPEEIVMTRDSWTVRQHHMDDLSKWKFNSPWKFIIRLQEEEESVTGRVVKTAVREALEEFTSSLLQQDRMDNPWGSVLENLKSLFVSRSVQKDTAGQTSEASVTSLAKPNTEPSSKSPTSRTKRLSFKSPVTVVESTLKRARTSEKLGYQSGQTSTWQAKNFWRQFLQDAFPDYHNKCYFIPPIYMNRVPLSRQLVAGMPVLVPQAARGQAGWSPIVITTSDLEQPQDLCHRLEVSNLIEASERILCSDDLSDHHAPWEVTAEVSEKLQKWWRSVVAVHGPHPLMTSECYEHLWQDSKSANISLSHLELHHLDLEDEESTTKAASYMADKADNSLLHVLVDEAGPDRREIADFLHSLRIEKPVLNLEGTYPAPPSLEFRDVLVLCANPTDSAVVRGLQHRILTPKFLRPRIWKDIATARTNVVWLADPNHVRGLERKIVVWLLDNVPDFTDYRLHAVSRCTSQLVFVLPLEQDFISKSVSSSSLDLML